MADVSLIPKEQKKRSLSRSAAKRSSGPKLSRAAKIGIVLLAVFVLGGAGLYIWKQSLSTQRDELRTQLTQMKGQRDAALEKRVTTLNTLLNSFDDVLTNHRRWSRLLSVLEEQVVPGIVFIQFEGNYETATAALQGISPNYTRFAQQVKALERVTGVREVNVDSVGLNREGDVAFTARALFDRNFIKGVQN